MKTPLDIVGCNAPRSAGNLAESVPRSFETWLLPPREKTGFADGEKCTKKVQKTLMHSIGAIQLILVHPPNFLPGGGLANSRMPH